MMSKTVFRVLGGLFMQGKGNMGYRRVGLVNARLGECHTMPQRWYVSVVFGDKGVDDVIIGDFACDATSK